jgi:hypothetical protein
MIDDSLFDFAVISLSMTPGEPATINPTQLSP